MHARMHAAKRTSRMRWNSLPVVLAAWAAAAACVAGLCCSTSRALLRLRLLETAAAQCMHVAWQTNTARCGLPRTWTPRQTDPTAGHRSASAASRGRSHTRTETWISSGSHNLSIILRKLEWRHLGAGEAAGLQCKGVAEQIQSARVVNTGRAHRAAAPVKVKLGGLRRSPKLAAVKQRVLQQRRQIRHAQQQAPVLGHRVYCRRACAVVGTTPITARNVPSMWTTDTRLS